MYRSQKEAFNRFKEEKLQRAPSDLEERGRKSKPQSIDKLKKIIPKKNFKEDLVRPALDSARLEDPPKHSALAKRTLQTGEPADASDGARAVFSPHKLHVCALPATKENTARSQAKERSSQKPQTRACGFMTSGKKKGAPEEAPSHPGSEYRIAEASAGKQGPPADEPSPREPLEALFEKVDPRFKASVEKAHAKVDYREAAQKTRPGLLLERPDAKASAQKQKRSEGKQSAAAKLSAGPQDVAGEADSLMDKLPALRRFEHLLRPATQLPLPHGFAQLLHKFENLDSILNFFAMKDAAGSLGSLQKAFVNSLRQ